MEGDILCLVDAFIKVEIVVEFECGFGVASRASRGPSIANMCRLGQSRVHRIDGRIHQTNRRLLISIRRLLQGKIGAAQRKTVSIGAESGIFGGHVGKIRGNEDDEEDERKKKKDDEELIDGEESQDDA